MTLLDACRTQDLAWVQGWIAGQFEVEVDPVMLAKWLARLSGFIAADEAQKDPNCKVSDGTCRYFLKVHLSEAGCFPAGMGGGKIIRFTVPLNIFFLHLEETEEMLANLRRPDRGADLAARKCQASTPAIERTQRVLAGVDAVARRVAPTDGAEKNQAEPLA